MSKIGIAGDWHGTLRCGVRALNTFLGEGITDIYHLGDFGVWETHRHYERTLNGVLEQNSQTLWVTLGNHENYDIVETFITHPDYDYVVYDPDQPHILYFKRGARFLIGDKSFVSLGGANSIDRFMREPGLSWWAGEQISSADVEVTIAGGRADIVLAHDCPSGVVLPLMGNPEAFWGISGVAYAGESRVMLRQVADVVQPKRWFFGHYHIAFDANISLSTLEDTQYETQFTCFDLEYSKTNLAIYDTASDELRFLG